jgi:hypothetical protein
MREQSSGVTAIFIQHQHFQISFKDLLFTLAYELLPSCVRDLDVQLESDVYMASHVRLVSIARVTRRSGRFVALRALRCVTLC